jgi:hypothetical protein
MRRAGGGWTANGEPWPYWDTTPLMRHRKGDAVALRDVESCGRGSRNK